MMTEGVHPRDDLEQARVSRTEMHEEAPTSRQTEIPSRRVSEVNSELSEASESDPDCECPSSVSSGGSSASDCERDRSEKSGLSGYPSGISIEAFNIVTVINSKGIFLKAIDQ